MGTLRIVGPEPFGRDARDRPVIGAATVWIEGRVLVTDPRVHLLQVAFLDAMSIDDAAPDPEAAPVPRTYALLYLTEQAVVIPLTRNALATATAADRLLQSAYLKSQIRFIGLSVPGFLEHMKREGELWRVAPSPKTPREMQEFIEKSLVAIDHEQLYYYNPHHGIRYLTFGKLTELGQLPADRRRAQLMEIARFLDVPNCIGAAEVELWPRASAGPRGLLRNTRWAELAPGALDKACEALLAAWRPEVDPDLQDDDSRSEVWRTAMFRSLTDEPHRETIAQPSELLGPEYYRNVEWLPGVRYDGQEWDFDDCFDQAGVMTRDDPSYWVAHELAANVIREYADLDYINVGRLANPLSQHPETQGRRDVFLMEYKRLNSEREVLRVVRFHKWGIREHLDAGRSLLESILRAQEYADYIFNRRLACRQLGMNLPDQVSQHYIRERYRGSNPEGGGPDGKGLFIWANYSERDFIQGKATNRVSDAQLKDPLYALAFASLLGRAAATNLVVGRVREEDRLVIFDMGDELILHDRQGMPRDLVVCDHSSSLGDYETPLDRHIRSYARPVNARAHLVPEPARFATQYLDAFLPTLGEVQQHYRQARRAYDNFFLPQTSDGKGNFANRWERVLRRLDACDPDELATQLRAHLVPLGGNP